MTTDVTRTFLYLLFRQKKLHIRLSLPLETRAPRQLFSTWRQAVCVHWWKVETKGNQFPNRQLFCAQNAEIRTICTSEELVKYFWYKTRLTPDGSSH